MKLQELKGVGDKTAQLLGKLNIYSVEELISYFPRRHDRFEEPILATEIKGNTVCGIEIATRATPKHFRAQSGKEMLVANVYDKKGTMIKATWFNMPFLKNQLKPGLRYIFHGELIKEGNQYTMVQPTIYQLYDYELLTRKLQPVYPLKQGLTNNLLKKTIKQALTFTELLVDKIPPQIVERYNLMEYKTAVRNIHFPQDDETLFKARKRLVFDEFYTFLSGLKKLKEEKVYEINHYEINYSDATARFIEKLPFVLTDAQLKAYNDIMSDLTGAHTGNRLIQGDVGSGKTIVALLAMMNTCFSGYQSAMMVPTEVLANQHFETIKKLFDENGIDLRVEVLTGSVTVANKRKIKADIEAGNIDILIGTHAIIEDNVIFEKLALVITDEQHRFGVKQRDKLANKSRYPHVVVMSATPIPRTLAIILYGDLDISVIDAMPQNRKPIKTCVINEGMRNNSYNFITKQIKLGHQAYVICPMVEDSDELDAENVIEYSQHLREVLSSDVCIEYLHGKMKSAQKNEIMERFARGEIDILVSTTVIEVGINVPNATVIMIENAERFGLAQLHQLRGRVGRGSDESYCILVNGNENEQSKKRLNVLYESNDGFYIANEDLKTRGPGDLFGVRQSGELLFYLGDIYSDSDMLTMANEAVNQM